MTTDRAGDGSSGQQGAEAPSAPAALGADPNADPVLDPNAGAPAEDWQLRGLQRQLAQGRRLLAVIEEQAAGHTTLSIPAELQVNLENQRARVTDLEQRLAGHGSTDLALKAAPMATGGRSLQEIMDYLSVYCEPALVNSVMKQVILAPTYRRGFRWDMTLRPNAESDPPSAEAVIADISYSFEQIASAHVEEAVMRTFAVYHVPSQLSARGRLDRMRIDADGDPLVDLVGRAVERFADRNAYGTYYRVPYNLRRGQAARVSAEVTAFHPARSEEILVSYYPCTGYTATIRLPLQDAERFQLRVEFWHPSRPAEWMADDVTTTDGFEVSSYRIDEPLLPYQGLRVAWHFR